MTDAPRETSQQDRAAQEPGPWSREPTTATGRRLFTDNDPMDMLESDGVTWGDVVAIEREAAAAPALDRIAELEAALQQIIEPSLHSFESDIIAAHREIARTALEDVSRLTPPGDRDRREAALTEAAERMLRAVGPHDYDLSHPVLDSIPQQASCKTCERGHYYPASEERSMAQMLLRRALLAAPGQAGRPESRE